MTVFFDTSTKENRSLMAEFDTAFETYRKEGSSYLRSLTDKDLQPLAYAAEIKKALRLYKEAPLPSVANKSNEAFGKLADLTLAEAKLLEKALGKINEPGPEANLMQGIVFNLVSVFKKTVGQAKFAPITAPMMQKAIQTMTPPNGGMGF